MTLWSVSWEKEGASAYYSAHSCVVTPLEGTPVAMNFLGALFCVSKATFTFIEIAAGLSGEAGVDVVLALGRFF